MNVNNMEEVIEMIKVWDENPENMRQSYPYGLGQYIEECIDDDRSLLALIEHLYANGALDYLIKSATEVNNGN